MSGGEHLPKLSVVTAANSTSGSSQSASLASNLGILGSASKLLHHQQHSTSSSSSSNNNNGGMGGGTMSLNLANQRYVKLNVGGRLFSTSLDTLTKQDNMLRAMFSGRLDVSTDADGYILIDRCGRHFEFMLNFLRDDDPMYAQAALQDKSELELFEILREAKFYYMQPLVALLEQKIMLNKAAASGAAEPYYGPSVVSMITSKHDLARILSSTDKPCIRLLINRHNNKYSYTNTSDDNLLKNIELFERMANKFKNRIMFIKDTTSNEEICCWYFHGGGKKLAEVCCTSIVYTTEKKQTKVEFPDSKILEEIFVNAVLFESKETQTSNNAVNNNNNLDAVSAQIRYENGACMDTYDEDETAMMPRISLYQAGGVGSNGVVIGGAGNSGPGANVCANPTVVSAAVTAATVSNPTQLTSALSSLNMVGGGPNGLVSSAVAASNSLPSAAAATAAVAAAAALNSSSVVSSSGAAASLMITSSASSTSNSAGGVGGGGGGGGPVALTNAANLVSVAAANGRRGNR